MNYPVSSVLHFKLDEEEKANDEMNGSETNGFPIQFKLTKL